MRTLALAALLVVPALGLLAVAAPASASSSLPCEPHYRWVWTDMDHGTWVPDGVQCKQCHVTYREYYFDMDHPTYVPNGVACE